MIRKRLLALPMLAFVLLSCTDGSDDLMSPQAGDDSAPQPSLSATLSSTTTLTGCLADVETAPAGTASSSPCDAARNDGFPGVYLLPPLVGSVSLEGTFQSGLASLITVEARPIGDCTLLGGAPCETTTLPVSEGTNAYETAWKVRKNGPQGVPVSDWRIVVLIDIGDGPQPVAWRDVALSDDPSIDQPSDDPLLVIQRGSNQPIKLFISNDACDNAGDVSVTCLIGDGGGQLFIGGIDNPNVVFTVGSGNGARVWTAEFIDGNVDTDAPGFGQTVRVTASPEPAEALIGSSILFCEDLGRTYQTPGSTVLHVVQEDDEGQTALPPIAAPDCSIFQTGSASGIFQFLEDGFETLASAVLPRPLVATTAVGSLSGGGGSVRRLSDFRLTLLAAAEAVDGVTDLDTLYVGSATESVRAKVDVENSGNAIPGAAIRFFPDGGGTASCPTDLRSDESCYEPGSSYSGTFFGGETVFVTGAAGEAYVDWKPGAVGTRELKALGCGIAVPGSDSELTGDVYGLLQDELPGSAGNCDRDPGDEDGNSTDGYPDGYANGPATGTDPFEPVDEYEVALNDLPITFTVELVCDASGSTSVTCQIDNDGGILRIGGGGQPQVEVEIGSGNGDYEYTVAFTGDIDVDVPLFGQAVSIVAKDATGTVVPVDLSESTIKICEASPVYETPGSSELFVIQKDADGTTVLPQVDVTCPLWEEPTSTSLLDVLDRGLQQLASLIAPDELNAGSAVGSLSGGGGSVRRLSDFQLGVLVRAEAQSLNLGTVRLGSSITAQVNVTNAGAAVDGARIWFYPDAGGTLTPVSGTNTRDEGSGVFSVLTGTDGAARIDWAPGSSGSPQLRALGCGIAVPGTDTPLTDTEGDGVLGVLQNCDRDPTDTDGYANGTRTSGDATYADGNDPFEPVLDLEIAVNDLPISITADVCDEYGTAVPDGTRESAWDCANSISFPVNLKGGGKDQPQATLLWMNDANNLYLAVQLPRDSDAPDTSLWFEFDSGQGSDGTASANDDLIGVERTKGVSVESDRYLDANCAASNGSSICGSIDPAGQDVVAGVGFNQPASGDFIFYEVSHPLSTGQAEDFSLQSGESVGLFLRLAIGNGAQGNTIWPAFRDYFVINIQ